MIDFLLSNFKIIISCVSSLCNLKQEIKNQSTIIEIQKKIYDVKKNDLVTTADDVVELMLRNKE